MFYFAVLYQQPEQPNFYRFPLPPREGGGQGEVSPPLISTNHLTELEGLTGTRQSLASPFLAD